MRVRAVRQWIAGRPWHTVRGRLALLYSGGFLASGLALLAIPALFVRTGSTSVAAVPAARHLSSARSAVASQQHSTDVHLLIVGSAVALATLVVVSFAFGWFFAGRVLRPLRTITATAREISASNLDRRLALTGPDDEFKELGETLDQLLDRLQSSFDSQRHFVANASHELRTPLTAERTVLQVALADPDATTHTLRVACEQVISLGDHQERLIDALLTLASSESGVERWEPCDLAEITATALARSHDERNARGLHLDEALEPARLTGERKLIDSLVTNLVDNAIRHNVAGGRISVTTSTTSGHAAVSVGNTGRPVPPADVARLFEPFQRLEARIGRPDGHGLGLAIVRAIADAHGATIDARPRSDGGLQVTVTFAPPPRSSD